MTGIYGTNKEDKHFESVLMRHLDATSGDDYEAKLQERVDMLMEDCINPAKVMELWSGYELMENQIGDLIEIVADCAFQCKRGHVEDLTERYARLGKAIEGMVMRELRRVAEHQMENKE